MQISLRMRWLIALSVLTAIPVYQGMPLGDVLRVYAVIAFYFLPTIIAVNRRHHQRTPIVLVNTLLGWTVIGWFVALIWAVSAIRRVDADGYLTQVAQHD